MTVATHWPIGWHRADLRGQVIFEPFAAIPAMPSLIFFHPPMLQPRKNDWLSGDSGLERILHPFPHSPPKVHVPYPYQDVAYLT